MKSTDLLCLGSFIVFGLIYGVTAMITKKTSFRGISYEGEKAVVAGRTIVILFGLLALFLICLMLN